MICLLFSISFCVSCIRETLPECPYQYNIQLFVKDRNYFNDADIDENIVDHDFPFNHHISNIHYTLENLKTGKAEVKSGINKILENDKSTSIIIDHVPNGQYLLTVWGNVNETMITTKALHNEETENTDIYLGSTTLNIITGIAQNTTIDMERTMGKLLVNMNNLPESINQVDHTISGIYKYTNAQRLYREIVNVSKTFQKSAQILNQTSTFLAPTVNNEPSRLSISFYPTDNNTSKLTLPPIDLRINRNEITKVNVDYNGTQGEIEIWIYVDKNWTLIKSLNISEIQTQDYQ